MFGSLAGRPENARTWDKAHRNRKVAEVRHIYLRGWKIDARTRTPTVEIAVIALCDSVCECRSKRPASTMCSPAVGSVCRRPSSSPARPSMSPGDQPPCLPCLQVCVQTCAVVYVRTAAVGTTLLCACQCACSLHVRACRLTMQLVADYATCCIVSRYSIPLCTGHDTSIPKACKLAYSHDTKHTLMHRFFGDAQGQGLDDKHQHRPTGHEADTSLHLGICARVVSAPSDLASGRPSASC